MKQLVKVNERYIPDLMVGLEDDNLVERVIFTNLPRFSQAQVVELDWKSSEVNEAGSTVGDLEILSDGPEGYIWEITDRLTQLGGQQVKAALLIRTLSNQRWHSKPFMVSIEAGLQAIEEIIPATEPSMLERTRIDIATHSADMAAQERRVEDMVAEGGSQLAEVERIAGEVADDAQGVEADKGVTHGYMVRAETAADGAGDSAQTASDRAAAADGSALRAEAAYNRIVGLELAVDVADGLLCLYSSGLDSPIDIAINGQTLEVWKV